MEELKNNGSRKYCKHHCKSCLNLLSNVKQKSEERKQDVGKDSFIPTMFFEVTNRRNEKTTTKKLNRDYNSFDSKLNSTDKKTKCTEPNARCNLYFSQEMLSPNGSCTELSGQTETSSKNSLNSAESNEARPSRKYSKSLSGSHTNIHGKLVRHPERKSSVPETSHIHLKRPKKDAKRAEIVAAVTKRLYTTKKKSDLKPEPEEPVKEEKNEEDDEPEELKLCSRARAKLLEISKRALNSQRKMKRQYTDIEIQTDYFPTIRVKEVSVNTYLSGIKQMTDKSSGSEIVYQEVAVNTELTIVACPLHKLDIFDNTLCRKYCRMVKFTEASVTTADIINSNTHTETYNADEDVSRYSVKCCCKQLNSHIFYLVGECGKNKYVDNDNCCIFRRTRTIGTNTEEHDCNIGTTSDASVQVDYIPHLQRNKLNLNQSKMADFSVQVHSAENVYDISRADLVPSLLCKSVQTTSDAAIDTSFLELQTFESEKKNIAVGTDDRLCESALHTFGTLSQIRSHNEKPCSLFYNITNSVGTNTAVTQTFAEQNNFKSKSSILNNFLSLQKYKYYALKLALSDKEEYSDCLHENKSEDNFSEDSLEFNVKEVNSNYSEDATLLKPFQLKSANNFSIPENNLLFETHKDFLSNHFSNKADQQKLSLSKDKISENMCPFYKRTHYCSCQQEPCNQLSTKTRNCSEEINTETGFFLNCHRQNSQCLTPKFGKSFLDKNKKLPDLEANENVGRSSCSGCGLCHHWTDGNCPEDNRIQLSRCECTNRENINVTQSDTEYDVENQEVVSPDFMICNDSLKANLNGISSTSITAKMDKMALENFSQRKDMSSCIKEKSSLCNELNHSIHSVSKEMIPNADKANCNEHDTSVFQSSKQEIKESENLNSNVILPSVHLKTGDYCTINLRTAPENGHDFYQANFKHHLIKESNQFSLVGNVDKKEKQPLPQNEHCSAVEGKQGDSNDNDQQEKIKFRVISGTTINFSGKVSCKNLNEVFPPAEISASKVPFTFMSDSLNVYIMSSDKVQETANIKNDKSFSHEAANQNEKEETLNHTSIEKPVEGISNGNVEHLNQAIILKEQHYPNKTHKLFIQTSDSSKLNEYSDMTADCTHKQSYPENNTHKEANFGQSGSYMESLKLEHRFDKTDDISSVKNDIQTCGQMAKTWQYPLESNGRSISVQTELALKRNKFYKNNQEVSISKSKSLPDISTNKIDSNNSQFPMSSYTYISQPKKKVSKKRKRNLVLPLNVNRLNCALSSSLTTHGWDNAGALGTWFTLSTFIRKANSLLRNLTEVIQMMERRKKTGNSDSCLTNLSFENNYSCDLIKDNFSASVDTIPRGSDYPEADANSIIENMSEQEVNSIHDIQSTYDVENISFKNYDAPTIELRRSGCQIHKNHSHSNSKKSANSLIKKKQYKTLDEINQYDREKCKSHSHSSDLCSSSDLPESVTNQLYSGKEDNLHGINGDNSLKIKSETSPEWKTCMLGKAYDSEMSAKKLLARNYFSDKYLQSEKKNGKSFLENKKNLCNTINNPDKTETNIWSFRRLTTENIKREHMPIFIKSISQELCNQEMSSFHRNHQSCTKTEENVTEHTVNKKHHCCFGSMFESILNFNKQKNLYCIPSVSSSHLKSEKTVSLSRRLSMYNLEETNCRSAYNNLQAEILPDGPAENEILHTESSSVPPCSLHCSPRIYKQYLLSMRRRIAIDSGYNLKNVSTNISSPKRRTRF